MRLAILSDIHGNLIALEKALRDLDAVGGADKVWVLGDLAAFGPRPAECIRRVRDLTETYGKDNVRYVRGNTDRYLVRGARPSWPAAEDEAKFHEMQAESRAMNETLVWTLAQLPFEEYSFLARLDRETSLDAPGYGGVIGYHGTPGDDEGYLRPETPAEEARDALLDREGRLGIGGHIHIQLDRDLGSWRAVNVGSVGMSFEHPGLVQWGLFTFDNGDVTVDLREVPYDVNGFIIDMHTCGLPTYEWALGRFRLK